MLKVLACRPGRYRRELHLRLRTLDPYRHGWLYLTPPELPHGRITIPMLFEEALRHVAPTVTLAKRARTLPHLDDWLPRLVDDIVIEEPCSGAWTAEILDHLCDCELTVWIVADRRPSKFAPSLTDPRPHSRRTPCRSVAATDLLNAVPNTLNDEDLTHDSEFYTKHFLNFRADYPDRRRGEETNRLSRLLSQARRDARDALEIVDSPHIDRVTQHWTTIETLFHRPTHPLIAHARFRAAQYDAIVRCNVIEPHDYRTSYALAVRLARGQIKRADIDMDIMVADGLQHASDYVISKIRGPLALRR